jgi:hypothetical protein
MRIHVYVYLRHFRSAEPEITMKKIQLLSLAVIPAIFSLPTAVNASVSDFVFGRQTNYAQTASNTVALSTDEPYKAEIRVEESSSTSAFSAGTLTLPGTAVMDLSYSSEDKAWSLEGKFSTLAKLNATDAIPAGTYTLAMTKTGGGLTSIAFTLTSDDLTFPTAPVVSNFTALQSVDATSAVTISWGAWTAATANDYIMVSIRNANTGDDVYDSPNPLEGSALAGTATSVTIPANTLVPGTSYVANVEFLKINEFSVSGAVSDFPSAAKVIYAQSRTQIPLATSGTTPLDALLSFQLWNNIAWNINSTDGDVAASVMQTGTAHESIVFSVATNDSISLSKVLFTGPASSGLSSTAATALGYFSNNGVTTYQYQIQALTPYLPTGSYTVSYDGTAYTGDISYTPQDADRVYLTPTLTMSDGKVTKIAWTAYDSAFALKNISSADATVSVQIVDNSYNTIVENDNLDPSTTSIDLSSDSVYINSINAIYLIYNGARNASGTSNGQFYAYTPTVSDSTNIFSTLTHDGWWIAPTGTVAKSFGWISDLFYPWIYSASQDILSNGSYQGNGTGWMYIYSDGASLADGFYVYRYATASWGWTNYNWGGWLYDYGTGTPAVGAGWVDITQ